ncbi:hypothetical protein HAD_02330 [Hyphomonas adhaerens MHS-3]|uniref:Uncharacterized protein n=1 Tax=Hyphomonas adhaerens MHS-3 TaxID=1280949 RepID=A0A069E3Q2_9PROT|nr:hypothetical protein [Hyphomonas adhaerens]KCZ84479.1 hypothetical protein HAD_02330 [Hyphomonas adhaerens MHS-3]|tara:strand:- start:387 stop:563 length:177 start_codon:yes stop_codon:yes gene_type:complete
MSRTTGSHGNKWLYFIAGALIAGPIGFGLYHFVGEPGADTGADVEISVSENGIRIDEN